MVACTSSLRALELWAYPGMGPWTAQCHTNSCDESSREHSSSHRIHTGSTVLHDYTITLRK
uniref:SFRICE_027363 n=1 Tax=Spodoptera frugiperda TaxID=7108 RepID=A0A2H1WX39_SPOFR